MIKQITVEELFVLCGRELEKGNGKKNIVLSDDNEGNGYHGLFFGFTPVNKDFVDVIYDSHTNSPDDTIILG